ncbi:MAG: hypothetical protein ACREQY_19700 [Candidatus Binatia bacterium]
MSKNRIRKPIALGALVVLLGLAALVRAAEPSPEDTVREYLQALQDQNFARSYDLVSEGMKKDRNSGQVRSKEAWIKESQYIAQFSEAKIFEFQVFPGKVEGEKAFVPNILSSQDKFLNQLGADEHELYTLVKEGGQWKIDQQELIVDSAGVKKWFPEKAASAEKPAPPAAK